MHRPCAATLPKVASMLRFRALLRSPHAKAPLLRAAAARMSTQPPTTPHPYESFLSGTSANYVDDMYESWQQDPAPQQREKWPRSQLPTRAQGSPRLPPCAVSSPLPPRPHRPRCTPRGNRCSVIWTRASPRAGRSRHRPQSRPVSHWWRRRCRRATWTRRRPSNSPSHSPLAPT